MARGMYSHIAFSFRGKFLLGQCKKKFNAIRKIKEKSGWGPWSDEHGAGITAPTAESWDNFLKKNAATKPFRNRGWDFLHQVEAIMPFQASGANIFRPSGAGVSTVRETSPEWDLDKVASDMAKETDVENEVSALKS